MRVKVTLPDGIDPTQVMVGHTRPLPVTLRFGNTLPIGAARLICIDGEWYADLDFEASVVCVGVKGVGEKFQAVSIGIVPTRYA